MRSLPPFLLLSLLAMGSGSALAQQSPPDEKIAARMATEKEARKACRAEICKVFAEKKGDEMIGCDVTKTWLQDEITTRFLGNRVTWPWGHAQCHAKLSIDRADLTKLVTGPEATVKLKPHDVMCSLDRKPPETGEAYAVTFSIAPEVSYKAGKATKVVMHWGTIEAPVLAKGAIWTATATDNTFNVLSGGLVDEINSFMFHHCQEAGFPIAEPK